jgi:hypothetical protein
MREWYFNKNLYRYQFIHYVFSYTDWHEIEPVASVVTGRRLTTWTMATTGTICCCEYSYAQKPLNSLRHKLRR